MRPVSAMVLGLVLSIVASGCARVAQAKDDLFAAVYLTETLAREFRYTEKAGKTETSVEGAIADDFRYRLAASINENPVAEEVAFDDARALRVTDAELLNRIGAGGEGSSMDALSSGRWVLDPTGANQLFSDGFSTPQPGSDPLLDALQVLKYARDAAGEAAAVVKFNPEASNYRPKFDPFPHPKGDVIRYDLIPPTLTPVDPNTSGASAFRLPGVRFFRRMSVYVDGGRVVEVRERISVKDMLEDPVSNIATRIGDYGIEFPEDASLDEQAALLLESLNAQSGPEQAAIRVRDVRVVFKEPGTRPAIELPGDAVPGSLAGVREHGQILFEQVG